MKNREIKIAEITIYLSEENTLALECKATPEVFSQPKLVDLMDEMLERLYDCTPIL